jgi:hypothetical protein
MAQLDEITYEGKYNSAVSGLFKDNVTQAIEETDLRALVTDTKDSFWNTVSDLQSLTTATGTDTYAVTGGITAYSTGFTIFVKFTNANTGAATLNVNSLGAKAIKKSGTTALAAGDIAADQILALQYDGTNFQVVGGGGGATITDALSFKGVIDCSANPNYPAADAGDTYKVSVAGKIGGGSGPNVEIGDLLLCTADATSSGNHATVGTSWTIQQVNIDGAVTGPASATDNAIARFDSTTGKIIQNSGATVNDSSEITAVNLTASGQNGTGLRYGYFDANGKLVRNGNARYDTTTGATRLDGLSDIDADYTLEIYNLSGDLVARFSNGQILEIGGTEFLIEVPAGIASGNARIRMLDNLAMGLILEDTAGKEYASIRTTDSDERFNVSVPLRFRPLTATESDAAVESNVFRATTSTTNSAVNLIGSVSIPSDETDLLLWIKWKAVANDGTVGWGNITHNIQRTSAGTVQAVGTQDDGDGIQRTAGDFTMAIAADDTNKRANINLTNNSAGGKAFKVTVYAQWILSNEPV